MNLVFFKACAPTPRLVASWDATRLWRGIGEHDAPGANFRRLRELAGSAPVDAMAGAEAQSSTLRLEKHLPGFAKVHTQT